MSNIDFDFDFQSPTAPIRKPQALVRFYLKETEHPAKSAEAGRPVHVDVEMIEIRNPGSRDTHVDKVSKQWIDKYPEQYKKWQETRRNTIEGTPLTQWPAMTPALIADLRYQQIHTVEHLALCPDSTIQKLGMGMVEWKKKAQAYLEAAKDTAAVQKYAAENEHLKNEIELLKKQIADIGAKVNKK
jgi:hypothetical protein